MKKDQGLAISDEKYLSVPASQQSYSRAGPMVPWSRHNCEPPHCLLRACVMVRVPCKYIAAHAVAA